jgi:8-oxo-dGTP pyrophosphatase MutT (NUDIX family)
MEQLLVDTPFSIVSQSRSFSKVQNVQNVQNVHYNHQQHNNVITCCNCGGIGHVYRQCNHPITSYGVICYRIKVDIENNIVYPEYLMVQRKDSLSYVEFMRGKYDIQNISYIMTLFSNMTDEERNGILINNFDNLWETLWASGSSKNFMKEYAASKEKFEKLQKGYYIKSVNNDLIFMNLEYIIETTSSNMEETEWGFPKGRRAVNEDDRRCALREFREETGMNTRNIKFIRDLKPVEEIFSGSNRVRYKHVYYIAKYSPEQEIPQELNTSLYDPTNKHMCREVKDVRWFNYTDAQTKIRNCNIERKELLKRVNNLVLKNLN